MLVPLTIFLKQKEEDWKQMLAQGKSSSPKKKRKKNIIHTICALKSKKCMKFMNL